MDTKETKKKIIQAGQAAVAELIKVAKEPIVDTGEDVTADRLKNAAATKKLAIFDAFEILTRIQDKKGENPKLFLNTNSSNFRNKFISLTKLPLKALYS
mgnify:CR=1 FL=1